MHLRALSKRFFHSGRLGAVTTSLGSLFQCVTTLSVNTDIPSGLVAGHQSRDQCLPLLSPCEKAADHNEVSCCLLQAEQSKRLQLLLLRLPR